MKRIITDSEVRIGIGKHPYNDPDPWYVTFYSRNLDHDRAEGWYPTYEAAAARSRQILDRRATRRNGKPSHDS